MPLAIASKSLSKMRHGKKFNHLGRKSAHRKAMLANMACSLIEHKRIKTTLAKAKALRVYIEPLVTKSKTDTTHSRRTVYAYLQNKEAVKTLFTEIRDEILERPGGYTRILKIGNRLGDNAEMAMIEFVDFNEYLSEKLGGGSSRRRRRRRKKGGSDTNKPSSSESKQEAVEAAAAAEEEAKVAASEAAEEAAEEATETAEETPEATEAPSAEAADAKEEAAPKESAGKDEQDEKKKDE